MRGPLDDKLQEATHQPSLRAQLALMNVFFYEQAGPTPQGGYTICSYLVNGIGK